ncbi:MAG: amidohydrolase family protein [Kiritimatiellia bacterium]|nr:amidohydrolase family protein [Kiritimatiellia bacterium]
MIIDVHAHVFAFPKIKLPDSTTFMSAEDQIAVMNAKGIDKAIILPLNNSETPAEHQSLGEILYICKKYPGRFIPFCNIDPRLPRRPDLIKLEDFTFLLEQYREYGCKGLGEFTARMYWDDPSVLLLLEACEKVGFPVTFHTITAEVNSYGLIDEIGLPRLEKVLGMFPNLKMFGHSPGFWSEISGEVANSSIPVKPGGRLKDLMRRYTGLYGDLSAGSGFNALTRDPEHAYKFIDEFQDRLMLGLDYCSVRNDMQHIEWFKAARDAGHISPEAYEKIMWQNINKAINLGL